MAAKIKPLRNQQTLKPLQIIRPQPGPQEAFLTTDADIAIFGGAAGGGKSFGVLIEGLRHVTTNPLFSAVFFRRTTVQIRNPGGLWDASMRLYPFAGGKPVAHVLEWRWAHGGKIKLAHLEHESTVLEWQGAEIPLIVFDELTHFTRNQFFYLLSRNRSMSGVRGYIRATTNPDADSWVAELIAWWIDQDTGYPIAERSGKVRWFIRRDDTLLWADSREELMAEYGRKDLPLDHEQQPRPKSLTFIASKITDNQALMEKDPDYLANLQALSRVERERLLGGNWKIKPAAGLYFRRHEVTMWDTVPTDVVKWVRRWDLAATEKTEGNDPDWTAGVLMGRRSNGRFVVADCISVRKNSAQVRALVSRTANNDGQSTFIGLSQDPGQAGKDQVENYAAMLAGYKVRTYRETGDKVVRADPFAAQWQAGNVDVVRGPWNERYFTIMEQFPDDSAHDDEVDASSGGFQMLVKDRTIWDAL